MVRIAPETESVQCGSCYEQIPVRHGCRRRELPGSQGSGRVGREDGAHGTLIRQKEIKRPTQSKFRIVWGTRALSITGSGRDPAATG